MTDDIRPAAGSATGAPTTGSTTGSPTTGAPTTVGSPTGGSTTDVDGAAHVERARIDTTRASDGTRLRVNALGVDEPLATRTAAALAGGVVPRRRGWWYVTESFVVQMRRYGGTLLVGAIGSPLLYLLGLGLGLAAVIDATVADGANGPVDYVTFVAPALLVTAGVSVTQEEFTYTVMGGFKWHKTFFAINASPVSPRQLLGGMVLAVTFRILLVTGVYYLAIVLFGAVDRPLLGALTVLTGALAALAFGLPLLAYSASLTEDKGQFALVQRFVFMPLFLFSGTFYPLTTLPVYLQWIGWISPVWHGAELGRVLSYGAPTPGWLVVVHVGVLVALAVVGGTIAGRTFTRRLR
ncbi:ABC transporter permease [Miniimonas arenae]|uniref:ABC transporter permease n=1 Tax=Miniimonas arenae TaxID=676201 RepID=UPI0028A6691B|nr:ABC transporter permease [Miniimonas arenae]